MNDPVKHLNESTASALALSTLERIERIRSSRWIGYTLAKKVINKLDDLLTHPKTHRMPNLLLVGETNNGKTMIINRFHKQHPAYDNPDGNGITLPVLMMQAPPTPDEARFYHCILDKLFAPYKSSDRIDKKQSQVIQILGRINTRMLIIDEIHHILAGNLNKQRQFLNTIKYLGNELQIPIIGVGTKDAFNALYTDPQLANRFEPVMLPKWEMNTEFLKLLASFERMLPLHYPSNLIEPTMAIQLLTMSEGIIGELSAILAKAAIIAINTGHEQIDLKLLKSVDWIQPSERKWKAIK